MISMLLDAPGLNLQYKTDKKKNNRKKNQMETFQFTLKPSLVERGEGAYLSLSPCGLVKNFS